MSNGSVPPPFKDDARPDANSPVQPSTPNNGETYVERIEREVTALFVLFRRNSILGIVVVLTGGVLALRTIGLLPVAEAPKGLPSEPTGTALPDVNKTGAMLNGTGPSDSKLAPRIPKDAVASFPYLDGPLPGAIWSTFGTRGFLVKNGRLIVSPGSQQYVVTADLSLLVTRDQYSEAVIDAPRDSNESWVGVACRISDRGYYGYVISGTSRELFKIVARRHHTIAKKDGQTERQEYVDSRIRLECRGSTLRASVEDALDFLETDESIKSGLSGLSGYAYPRPASDEPPPGPGHPPHSNGTNQVKSWNGGQLPK